MAHLAVEETRQIYFEHHRGSGPPIVLIHGWAAQSHCWDGIAPALRAAGYEVVLVDLRGCGRSDKDFADVSIAALAADVVAVCQQLELKSPVINGWSLGGAVATLAAATPAANAGGLVLTAGASPRYTATDDWPHGGSVDDVEGVLTALASDRPNTFAGVAQAVYACAPSANVLNWIWGMFLQMGPIGDDSLRDLAHVDLRSELSGLTIPVLSLHGTADAFVPYAAAQAAIDLCRDGRLLPFDGVGHGPFLEDRDGYLSALTDFLAA